MAFTAVTSCAQDDEKHEADGQELERGLDELDLALKAEDPTPATA